MTDSWLLLVGRQKMDPSPPSRSNANVGTFVSHEKQHVRKSLNALSVLNGRFDSLCAERWLINCLFVTTKESLNKVSLSTGI